MDIASALLKEAQERVKVEAETYLLGRDHDADLFDGFGELIRLDEAGVVQIEVLEALLEDSLLRLGA